uniref:C2H2-type domain-containing protein n=1 Tax=Ignisphaera aggregans TaxID=334771 RepID=A0A7J3QGH6_9CREN
MRECARKYIELVTQLNTPFTMEVVKSIATLCNENPYDLWYNIASSFSELLKHSEKEPQAIKQIPVTANCWRCSACNKTFNDVKHLVNHITYFVRQKDKAHIELYQKIKRISDEQRKSFTEIAINILKC